MTIKTMNKTKALVLVGSIFFSCASAEASIVAKEGVFVLDSTGRYMDLFNANKSRFTLDHPQSSGYEAYGPDGFKAWLEAEGIPFIGLEPIATPPGDRYPTPEEVEARLEQLHANYPNLTQLLDIGRTGDGRHMYVLKISNNPTVDQLKPEMKYISSMHGDEITGRELMLSFAGDLLAGYGTDARITQLIDNTEIFIMASMNPDGSQRRQRANAAFIDLNRDFPDFSSDPNNSPDGRAIETQALMRFQAQRQFALSANFHGGAEVVNYPWDTTATRFPFDSLVRALSTEYASQVGYLRDSTSFRGGITNGYDWYEVDGGMQDWSYHWYNDLQLTIELSGSKWPEYARIAGYYRDNKAALLTYVERVHQGAGFKFANTNNRNGTVRISQNGRDLGTYNFRNSEFYKVLDVGSYAFDVRTSDGQRHNFTAEVRSNSIAPNYRSL